MKEIGLLVDEAAEGGCAAKALGALVFTEAESIEAVHTTIRVP